MRWDGSVDVEVEVSGDVTQADRGHCALGWLALSPQAHSVISRRTIHQIRGNCGLPFLAHQPDEQPEQDEGEKSIGVARDLAEVFTALGGTPTEPRDLER